ncbi:hypothetical protein COCVIDRAFT_84746 [Bipolaris victoriae FI3]|uniref:Secreted protein n=1 Tax=Bipolaris victoriae (strain FI3) TaxID=930091 RepID=W7EWY0_BIPV3|nr:hypothetical protein COCVIDRAFT_84746 [Bipolaris victoriae FI3]
MAYHVLYFFSLLLAHLASMRSESFASSWLFYQSMPCIRFYTQQYKTVFCLRIKFASKWNTYTLLSCLLPLSTTLTSPSPSLNPAIHHEDFIPLPPTNKTISIHLEKPYYYLIP